METKETGIALKLVRVQEPRGVLKPVQGALVLKNGWTTESFVEIGENGELGLCFEKVIHDSGKTKWFTVIPVL
jgi:hypothetical protein